MSGLGARIKIARQMNGYTQSQLAEKMGCSVNTIARWEHEKFIPSEKDIAKLSKILEVDFNQEVPNETNAEIDQMAMQLEDIRLELANAQKSKRRMIITIVIIVVLAILIYLIQFTAIHWIDPNEPDRQTTIIYYEEGGM